jgi:hypothetical protein
MLTTAREVHRRIVLNTPLALFIDGAFVPPIRTWSASVPMATAAMLAFEGVTAQAAAG